MLEVPDFNFDLEEAPVQIVFDDSACTRSEWTRFLSSNPWKELERILLNTQANINIKWRSAKSMPEVASLAGAIDVVEHLLALPTQLYETTKEPTDADTE